MAIHNSVARELNLVLSELEEFDDYDSKDFQDLRRYDENLEVWERESIVLCPFCNKISKNMVYREVAGDTLWICTDCNRKITK
ncbi:MAG: hypothetical protein P8Y23_03555 [Candidatus Lokiarchaeota archaeon]